MDKIKYTVTVKKEKLKETKNIYGTVWATILAYFAVITIIAILYFTVRESLYKPTELLLRLVIMYGAISYLIKYYRHRRKIKSE